MDPLEIPPEGRKKRSFFDHLSEGHLEYKTEVVENFLLSLKAKQFVILSGGTGTGKTSLAKAYGDFISENDSQNKRYAIVPVGSNWTDNRYILGYRNAITEKYKKTTSLELMLAAHEDLSKNGDSAKQYILILDEMNLSHVERYFSDIISCMESGGSITLDLDGSGPKELSIGKNLFVVGTVNMDETTFTLSPKVLDRANVLEFEAQSEKIDEYLKQAPSETPSDKSQRKDVEFLQDISRGIECREKKAGAIVEEMRKEGVNVDVDSMISDLVDVHKGMSAMNLPFGYRTVDDVMRFMYVAWKYEGGREFTNWYRYMDAQIRQKILPKIHGNALIKDHLESLSKFCGEHEYDESKMKLDRMIEVLKDQRYVTFNC